MLHGGRSRGDSGWREAIVMRTPDLDEQVEAVGCIYVTGCGCLMFALCLFFALPPVLVWPVCGGRLNCDETNKLF